MEINLYKFHIISLPIVLSRAIANERNANCESASRFCSGIVLKALLKNVKSDMIYIKREGCKEIDFFDLFFSI